MQVFTRKNDLNALLKGEKVKSLALGFVPTMGALHDGHLSLVKKAVSENDLVVVSIFVNPTQFDNEEDFEKYPENLQQDIRFLETVSEDLMVFAPSKTDIYDDRIVSRFFDFNGLEKAMEGAFRTGHFDGVATIVSLLLHIVNPQRAYFGEKDFQQLQIIKKLVELEGIPCEIIGCPIVREQNGLAKSSRNERLSKLAQERAGFIYQTLQTVKSEFGMKSASTIKNWVINAFNANELLELEYFEIADIETLTPMTNKQENIKYRAFIAAYVEGIRLIDNIALN